MWWTLPPAPSAAARREYLGSFPEGYPRAALRAHVVARALPLGVFLRERRMLAWAIAPLGTERLRFLRLHDTASGV